MSMDSHRKKVAREEEGLTIEVEIEEGAKRLPTDATGVTLWVTDIFNVLRMTIRDSGVHT